MHALKLKNLDSQNKASNSGGGSSNTSSNTSSQSSSGLGTGGTAGAYAGAPTYHINIDATGAIFAGGSKKDVQDALTKLLVPGLQTAQRLSTRNIITGGPLK